MDQADAENPPGIGSDTTNQFWDDLISVREVSLLTKLSKDQVQLGLAQGRIRGKLLGKVWVVSRFSAMQYSNGSVLKHKAGAEPGTEKAKHGGQAVLRKYGPEYFQRLSVLGGEAMCRKYGTDFWKKIGKAGGEVLKQKYGPNHYFQMGKKSGESRRKGRQTEPEAENPNVVGRLRKPCAKNMGTTISRRSGK